MAINQAQNPIYNQNFIQEIEQAIVQKQILISSLSNLNDSEKEGIIQQIRGIDSLLQKVSQNPVPNQSNNLQLQNPVASKVSLNELNLQAKILNLEKSLEAQNAKYQELQSIINRFQQNQQLTNIPLNINNISNDLNNKLIQNTSNNISIKSGLSADIIKEYLYLGWDYLVRDRLPKIFSTRLWLVIGGSYITQALGQDNVLKIVSIVIMVMFYILSEIALKMSNNTRQVHTQAPKFY